MVCCAAAARSAGDADRSSSRARRSTRAALAGQDRRDSRPADDRRAARAPVCAGLSARRTSRAAVPRDHARRAAAGRWMQASSSTRAGSRISATALTRIVDLGEWWERETGHAIPLGGIAMRRDLGDDLIRRTEQALTASVDHARASPSTSWPTIRRHAQEMEDDGDAPAHRVVRERLHARTTATEGEAAIRHLLDDRRTPRHRAAFRSAALRRDAIIRAC